MLFGEPRTNEYKCKPQEKEFHQSSPYRFPVDCASLAGSSFPLYKLACLLHVPNNHAEPKTNRKSLASCSYVRAKASQRTTEHLIAAGTMHVITSHITRPKRHITSLYMLQRLAYDHTFHQQLPDTSLNEKSPHTT